MATTGSVGGDQVLLERGPLRVELVLQPFSLTVRRGGRRLLRSCGLWVADGEVRDHFVQFTEGVVAAEELSPTERAVRAEVVASGSDWIVLAARLEGGREATLRVTVVDDRRIALELHADEEPLRLALDWDRRSEERFVGLGARHCTQLEQTGRSVQLGADRRYTGPDCPPEMLAAGGIPQGDCAPVPWLVSSRGYAVWVRTEANGTRFELGGERVSVSTRAKAGPLWVELLCDRTPAARLRAFCRLTGFPMALPEWAYGFWKSRDVHEHEDDVFDDLRGFREHRIALDAIVIDSPWATQYNTWGFNPHQFPDAEGMISTLRSDGVRTVVWVTPWINIDSRDGQIPPQSESERLHQKPAPNYAPADRWWREQAKRVLELGVEGIKADDGEGYYIPDHVRLADGRSGAEAAWALGGLHRECMQRALDDVHPGSGVLFGRSGWTSQHATGMTWAGDQASDFWSLRTLVVATLAAASSGMSNWSHDVGGYLGHRLVERCPPELMVRWLQFGCFTPLMQAHSRMAQEPWMYNERVLELYRGYVLLHEQFVPYVRAAAASAARSGLPIIRPLCLLDPGDARGWSISDAYGYGPALWVAPVLHEDAREREVALPEGDWIETWSGAPVRGGSEVVVPAPLERIPVWVRAGSIIVTYPAGHVDRGLGDVPESERPLVATLWGRPRCGRSLARLADGTRIGWRNDEWSVSQERDVTFEVRGAGA